MATSGVGMVNPLSLASQSVDTGLVQKRWQDNMLYMESLQADPMLRNAGLIKPILVGEGKNRIPKLDSMIIDITPKDKKGKAARSVELIFCKSLDMAPREGNAEGLLGNEDTFQLKYSTAYANDWAGGVVEDTFGIDFRELDVYGVYKEIRPLLGQWLGEVRGYYLRAAFNTGVSPNLTKAPVSLTAGLSANWYVARTALASQPSYDSTLADQENLVGIAASAGYAAAYLDVPELLTMVDYFRDTLYIEPVTIDGKQMYWGYLSSDQMKRLRDPSVSNSWGTYYQAVAATEDIKKVLPSADIVIGDELVLTRDPRYSTLTLTGDSSNYTLTFGYLKYGRVSTRATARSANNFDVNVFGGKGAMACYEPEAPHYENQGDEYNKFKGTGLFGAVGYNKIKWDYDSADQTDSTAQQEGYVNVLTGRH